MSEITLDPIKNAPKTKHHLKRKTSEILFVIGMLALPVIQFIIFWVIPNFNSIIMGFVKDGEFTLVNFTKFFKNLFEGKAAGGKPHELVFAIKNSLIYFAINIFISTPIVIFFSYVLFRKVPLNGVFKVVFYLPSIIGATITATLFKSLLSDGAPLYELLVKIGFITEEMELLGLFATEGVAFNMVIIYSIWTCVGINLIMFHGAMKRIPQEIFESAEIDGVGFFRQFFNIVVPLIWPTISTLIVFSLSGIFISYGAVMILTPNEASASMIGWYIVKETTLARSDAALGYPAAIGLIFTIVGLPFVLFVRWLLNKIGSNVEY